MTWNLFRPSSDGDGYLGMGARRIVEPVQADGTLGQFKPLLLYELLMQKDELLLEKTVDLRVQKKRNVMQFVVLMCFITAVVYAFMSHR